MEPQYVHTPRKNIFIFAEVRFCLTACHVQRFTLFGPLKNHHSATSESPRKMLYNVTKPTQISYITVIYIYYVGIITWGC